VPILVQQVYKPIFSDVLGRPTVVLTRRLDTKRFGMGNMTRYAITRYDGVAEQSFVCIYYYVPVFSEDDRVGNINTGFEVGIKYLEFDEDVVREVVRVHEAGLHESPSDTLFRIVAEDEGVLVPEFLKRMVLGL
jgi:hypothetical protein